MDLGIMASVFLVVMLKLIRRNFLVHGARLNHRAEHGAQKMSTNRLLRYNAFFALRHKS